MSKRKSLFTVISLLIALSLVFTLAGCGAKDDAAQQQESQTSVQDSGQQSASPSETAQVIEVTNAYLSSEAGKAPTISVKDVYDRVVVGKDPGYFLLSIQKPEDYAKGHVPGAINIPYSQIAKKENLAKLPKDKKIVVICYTGHTASDTVMFLNQIGYEAYAMKFGLMAWNDKTAGMGTVKPYAKSAGYPVDTTPVEAQAVNEVPQLATGQSTTEDIIIAATDAYLTSGKSATISAEEINEKVIAGKDAGYVLVSLQKPEDYAKGHIPGAINIPYSQIAQEENLKKLPKDKKIILICYTGHTASVANMFLNQLGYDSYALKFGLMAWNDKSAGMGSVPAYTTSAGYKVTEGANP